MSIRSMLFAVAFGIVSLTGARADGLRPMAGKSIDLGGISGIAYYTIERDGFHVVATLAQGEAGTPIRVVSVLAPGQRVVLATPQQAGAIEISRKGDNFWFGRRTLPRTELRLEPVHLLACNKDAYACTRFWQALFVKLSTLFGF